MKPKQSCESQKAWRQSPRYSPVSGVVLGESLSHSAPQFLQLYKGNNHACEVFPHLQSRVLL